MTSVGRAARSVAAATALVVLVAFPPAAAAVDVVWRPIQPRPGDVVLATVTGADPAATVTGALNGRALAFFPVRAGWAALTGIDVEVTPGRYPWRITVTAPGRAPAALTGRIVVARRDFVVQRLTLPSAMVDLDPATERRAVAEGETLTSLYRTVTPERLWRGPFMRPLEGTEPGSGFGSRRVINGQPRAPHTGVDYAAPQGTPVLAANDGRVALVGEFFFPGRLVVLDHGLGLYTVYFHLDEVRVSAGARVSRAEPIGTVGATGRATGPHLHFGALAGAARIDPETLLGLAPVD